MNQQTTISIDKETKKKAEKLAKAQGLTLSTVARILFRDYAQGKIEVGTRVVPRDENGLTQKKAKQLEKALMEIQNEKNLSPAFSTGEEAIEWLKNAT